MAKKRVSPNSNQYRMLRKVFAGLILTCFLVFVLGQSAIGVSAHSTLVWSSLLIIGVGIVAQMVIRLWNSWEEISDGSMGADQQSRD